ncbi:hypothetical protein [Arthrobacter crystallopoietes]
MPLLMAIADASGRGLSNDAGLPRNQPIRPIAMADLMNVVSKPERSVAE